MKCRELDRLLWERTGAVPIQAREHLNACTSCRDLATVLGTPMMADGSPSLNQVLQSITADLKPVRPLPPARDYRAALATIFCLVAAAGGLALGASALPLMGVARAVVVVSMLGVCAGLSVFALVEEITPGSYRHVSSQLLLIGVLGAIGLTISAMFPFAAEGHFWPHAWICLRAGAGVASLAALPISLVLRRGAILSPRAAGAVTGLLAGLVGTTVLELHCPDFEAPHILASHAGVALLGAAAGFVCGFMIEHRSSRSN